MVKRLYQAKRNTAVPNPKKQQHGLGFFWTKQASIICLPSLQLYYLLFNMTKKQKHVSIPIPLKENSDVEFLANNLFIFGKALSLIANGVVSPYSGTTYQWWSSIEMTPCDRTDEYTWSPGWSFCLIGLCFVFLLISFLWMLCVPYFPVNQLCLFCWVEDCHCHRVLQTCGLSSKRV